MKKNKSCSAKKPISIAGAGCNDKEDELTRLAASGLYPGRIGIALARSLAGLLQKLTWCDNGIQSEAAVAVSGCFPLIARSTIGSCLQLAFAAAIRVVSKRRRSLCIIHDVQT